MRRKIGWCALWLMVTACANAPAPEASVPGHLPGQGAFAEGVRAGAEGDSVRAEQYLVAALQEGYSPEETIPRLVWICAEAGRFRTAIRHGAPFVRKRPSLVNLRYLLVTLHVAIGHEAFARAELQEILRVAPEFGPALFMLGGLVGREEPEEARHYLERYLELGGEPPHMEEARATLRRISTQPDPRSGRLTSGDGG
jgi:hypothetical protein